ncbi:MAG: ferric reductase-like transmembrane domain-containing protein [Pseudomonadota bacterium]
MAAAYKPVIWVRSKLVYDLALLAGIFLYIFLYLQVATAYQDITNPIDGLILRMRAFGSCAFILLSMILCIGPLARLDRRFLPLLYNRRHFGVITFMVAVVHASYVMSWYFAFSPVDSYVALLSINTDYGQVLGFPFEVFGILALLILAILATTSHDFWLSFLTAPVWKALHMLLYVAYVFVVLHVALGPLQSDKSALFIVVVGALVLTVSALHFWTARREGKIEAIGLALKRADGMVIAGRISDIKEERAIIVPVPDGERVAIFRYGGKLSAILNACQHQNGPLGEGRIIDGCVTCPWHGYQYDPATGRSPPPFTEKVNTFNLKLEGDTILLDPTPNPPGTRVEPVIIPSESAEPSADLKEARA